MAGDLSIGLPPCRVCASASTQATSDEQLAAGGGEGDEAWAYDESVTFAALDVLLQVKLVFRKAPLFLPRLTCPPPARAKQDLTSRFCASPTGTQAAVAKLDDFSARELRWLLDPVLMLGHYHMHPDVAETLQAALADKEARRAAPRQQQQQQQQGAPGADAEDADTCHESVAMVLNDFVSDSWLSVAVMA